MIHPALMFRSVLCPLLRLIAAVIAGSLATAALAERHAGTAFTDPRSGIEWVRLERFAIARTETTIGQFRFFVQASGMKTLAEKQGGGSVFEAGWTQKPGWTWARPYGPQYTPADDEPAAHVTFDEAQAFCRWAGGRLPDDTQWRDAAYREQRAQPPLPFERGKIYPFPSGNTAQGAQCLEECGAASAARSVKHGASLSRGRGHARTSDTPRGVNGLHDMGANLWEWVDDPPGLSGSAERLTRGGSWWYGTGPMTENHRQSKPGDTAVVYIGFRCVRDLR